MACTLVQAAPLAAASDEPTPQADAQRSADAASADAARAAGEDDRAQLEAARKKLEAAAQEVAELSLRGAGTSVYLANPYLAAPRAIIGAQLDSNADDGLRVLSVSPGGPAAEAGLRSGDVITSVNGTDLSGRRGARTGLRNIAEAGPGSKLNMKLLRDGKPLDLTVTTRATGAFSFPPVPPVPPIPPIGPQVSAAVREALAARPQWGALPGLADLELATLSPQLGHYFGTDKGVLVVRAPEAGTLELKDGDVILSIDGRVAASSSQVTRILASYQAGEKLSLRIIREHKPLTVEGTLPSGRGALRSQSRARLE